MEQGQGVASAFEDAHREVAWLSRRAVVVALVLATLAAPRLSVAGGTRGQVELLTATHRRLILGRRILGPGQHLPRRRLPIHFFRQLLGVDLFAGFVIGLLQPGRDALPSQQANISHQRRTALFR